MKRCRPAWDNENITVTNDTTQRRSASGLLPPERKLATPIAARILPNSKLKLFYSLCFLLSTLMHQMPLPHPCLAFSDDESEKFIAKKIRNQVQGLPAWANTNAVSIGDVIEGDVLLVVLSNYMVDVDWLILACPKLAKIPYVLAIHGEGDSRLDHMKVSYSYKCSLLSLKA
ncbi:hypothetical protein REPUB_Repub13aG0261000 [Reevesia pubescens]